MTGEERLAAYGQVIWDASRADEGSISFTGANKVAAAVIAVADEELAPLERVKALIEGQPFWGLLSVSQVQQALAGSPPDTSVKVVFW